MKDIIILGIQGSGKGTQSKRILEYYGESFLYYEAGKILRALQANDNALGNYLKDLIDSGTLLDDSFVTSFFDSFLFILKENQFMLIDGFPRQIGQMFLLIDKLKKSKRDYKVLFLDLTEEEAVKRLSSRLICSECGAIYSTLMDDGIDVCKKCGGQLMRRADDEPAAIKRRLEQYYKLTLPVIDYFEEKGFLYRVDASGTQEEVFEKVKQAIEK